MSRPTARRSETPHGALCELADESRLDDAYASLRAAVWLGGAGFVSPQTMTAVAARLCALSFYRRLAQRQRLEMFIEACALVHAPTGQRGARAFVLRWRERAKLSSEVGAL